MPSIPKKMVITIDGPAGAGKSTIAKRLAKALQFEYLDTGAMYRSITLKALRQNINLEDEGVLAEMVKNTNIDFEVNTDGTQRVFLDGEDVTDQIRTIEVTEKTFYVARAPKVRALLVERQRDIGSKKNIVVEGRDTGTVVFPAATKKFYLDANFEERARRRIEELRQKGIDVDENKMKEDLNNRDQKDFTRAVGPLKKTDDMIIIDSTNLSIDEVVNKMLSYCQDIQKANG